MNNSASILTKDPSLYCVSAHNDNSYPQSTFDAHAVFRAESYSNYGWMVCILVKTDVTRSIFLYLLN